MKIFSFSAQFLKLAMLALMVVASASRAESGYNLWLRYEPLGPALRAKYEVSFRNISYDERSPTISVAASELRRGLKGLLRSEIGRQPQGDGAIILKSHVPGIASDGFRIRAVRKDGQRLTIIEGSTDVGVLYGSFALLRLLQTGRDVSKLDLRDAPRLPLRMLDHWDNLDGTVERGYAGPSLWNWAELPRVNTRMVDYARANASVGINAVVLNNVNSDARILTEPYLRKVAALADAWRPYGIKIYLSARFSAPKEIGGLDTADPLDSQVGAWWDAKADEIYRLIPDFGGFLVKANSEGQPGPQSYGRTHADGANALAAALAPHHGTLIWRAFVYSGGKDVDRAKQAFDEFAPLDGKFAQNVIVQIKNGPIDFQPREPFHPLFGRMAHTRVAIEVQLTKEYLGESTHLAYLGSMWSEVLRSRTARPHPASEVRDDVQAMAGVANVGSSENWTGSIFDQANWYAFGRLAWTPGADAPEIANEWVRLTFGNDPAVTSTLVPMMMRSREAVVDYMTPLGLAHLMASDHHYGPGPWVSDQPAPLWNPTYYHRADERGIGFDRSNSGTRAVSQYAPAVGRCLADLRCVPDKYLLWFHHVPWTYRLRSGGTLWSGLVESYDRGIGSVEQMQATWTRLRHRIDAQLQAEVAANLQQQLAEAKWWRNASIAYWQSVSGLPLPPGRAPPPHPLSWYKAVHFDTVPGFLAPRIDEHSKCPWAEGEAPCAN